MNKHKGLDLALKITYLLVGLGAVTYQITNISQRYSYDIYEEEQLIVGETMEKFKKNKEIPQGIIMTSPSRIAFTDNYVLPISFASYEEVLKIQELASSSNDLSPVMMDMVNVLFLNKDMEILNLVLDFKGVITRFDYPNSRYDSLMNIVVYEIVTKDTNKDDILDSRDYSNLYISHLDGSNFQQVTHDVNVVDSYFLFDYQKLIIKYH